MTIDGAIQLVLEALLAWMWMAGPMLLAALLVGVVVGILQAATQINEASISFLTKLIAIGVTLVALGSWSGQQLVEYTQRTISSIAEVTH
jgi:flagellar biosynthesis protein FliQ